MSGSELMEEIEEYTDWKPSPGSIYPLLSQLKEENVIDHYPDEDPSLKRFNLTEKGRKMLEEIMQQDEHFRSRQRSMRKIYWRLHHEMPEEIYERFAAIIQNIEKVNKKAQIDSQISTRFKEILEDTIQKLAEIGE
jgi:DNA-binding PadR family transcriptional regulator